MVDKEFRDLKPKGPTRNSMLVLSKVKLKEKSGIALLSTNINPDVDLKSVAKETIKVARRSILGAAPSRGLSVKGDEKRISFSKFRAKQPTAAVSSNIPILTIKTSHLATKESLEEDSLSITSSKDSSNKMMPSSKRKSDAKERNEGKEGKEGNEVAAEGEGAGKQRRGAHKKPPRDASIPIPDKSQLVGETNESRKVTRTTVTEKRWESKELQYKNDFVLTTQPLEFDLYSFLFGHLIIISCRFCVMFFHDFFYFSP